ncbi:MAG: hypothetical protein Q4B85_08395 [Lachnospiraceae bacterium]|nr:hypothetical protein [Lachnospiraceae bacterium]
MIPFAICGGTLIFDESVIPSSLEIRFLEMSPDYCTLRVPVSMEKHMEQVSGVNFSFFCAFEGKKPGEQQVHLKKGDFSLEMMEREKYWILYELTTDHSAYRSCAISLSKEYLSYIRARLSLEDAGLSHVLTGTYPEHEEEFCGSAREQMEHNRREIAQQYRPETWSWLQRDSMKPGQLSEEEWDYEHYSADAVPETEKEYGYDLWGAGLKFGISLETAAACRHWLSLGHAGYIEKSLERLGLVTLQHPFSRQNYEFLYIGNQFCGCQRPDLPLLSEILTSIAGNPGGIGMSDGIDMPDDNGMSDGSGMSDGILKPVLVLAPVSELQVQETQSYLSSVHGLITQLNLELELVVNDAGIRNWIRFQQQQGDFGRFCVSTGVLMHKRKRDARMKYLHTSDETMGAAESSRCDTRGEVRDGRCDAIGKAEKISNDAIGKAGNSRCDAMGITGNTWYLPWYQMNTGTFCPLHGLITRGDRGAYQRVTHCPGYCERACLLYPKHLGMMGRYNSVFGADLRAFSEGEYFRAACRKALDTSVNTTATSFWGKVGKAGIQDAGTEFRVILNI